MMRLFKGGRILTVLEAYHSYFQGSQCLCTPAPDASSKSIQDGPSPKLEQATSTTTHKLQPVTIDLDVDNRSKAITSTPFQRHDTPQAQDSSFYGLNPNIQHSEPTYHMQGLAATTETPYSDQTPSYVNAEALVPQPLGIPSSPSMHSPFKGTHNSSFGTTYHGAPSIPFGSPAASFRSMENYPNRETTASVNSVYSSDVNPLNPRAFHHYQLPERLNHDHAPISTLGNPPWGNAMAPIPLNYPIAPPLVDAIGSMVSTPQRQSLQSVTSRNWSTPFAPVMGVGASAAEENRAQRYQEHECTCGPGCGCLACPIHPHNDATTQEALHVGRLLSQDPLWSSSELEPFDAKSSEMLPEAIMSGEEWLESQYSFPMSDLMSPISIPDFEADSQGRSCCGSTDHKIS